MKVIVAGSRRILNYDLIDAALSHAISAYSIPITEIVEGEAKGVDLLAKRWAMAHSIPVKPFPANWDDLTAPGAYIQTNAWGRKYNTRAGHDRNQQMANYGDTLIVIWDGKSSGTKDMVERALKKGLPTYVYLVTGDFSNLVRDADGNPFCVLKA